MDRNSLPGVASTDAWKNPTNEPHILYLSEWLQNETPQETTLTVGSAGPLGDLPKSSISPLKIQKVWEDALTNESLSD